MDLLIKYAPRGLTLYLQVFLVLPLNIDRQIIILFDYELVLQFISVYLWNLLLCKYQIRERPKKIRNNMTLIRSGQPTKSDQE